MGIRKLIALGLCLVSIHALGQSKIMANFSAELGSNYFKAKGVQNIFLSSSPLDFPMETGSLNGKSAHLFAHSESTLSFFSDKSKPSRYYFEFGYDFDAYLGSTENGFDLYRFGNSTVKDALLDQTKVKLIGKQFLGFGKIYSFGNFEFRPGIYFTRVSGYQDLDLHNGRIKTNDFGSQVDLTYDYDYERLSDQPAFGAFLNSELSYSTDNQKLKFNLGRIGFLNGEMIHTQNQGDTSLQGFNLQDLIAGNQNEGSLEDHFLSGDTLNTLRMLPASFSLVYLRKSTLKSNFLWYGLSLRQEILGFSPLWIGPRFVLETEKLKAYAQVEFSNKPLWQGGLGIGYVFKNDHEIKIETRSLPGFILPENGHSLSAWLSYSITIK